MKDEDYDVAQDFIDRYDRGVEFIMRGLKDAKPGERVKWPVVRAARLTRIWGDFGKLGLVRDEKGMQEIADRAMDGIAFLRAATELMGHSPMNPEEVAESVGFDLTEEDNERMTGWLVDAGGSWILSDCVDRVEKLFEAIYKAETAEQQLYAVDKVLNMVHQRSDLSALFVEGGQQTLLKIQMLGTDEWEERIRSVHPEKEAV